LIGEDGYRPMGRSLQWGPSKLPLDATSILTGQPKKVWQIAVEIGPCVYKDIAPLVLSLGGNSIGVSGESTYLPSLPV